MNILIVGYGNIGFRHAQSFIKTRDKINLYVTDPDIKKKNLIKFKNKYLNIKYFKNINKINIKKFDLLIFSTNADIRYRTFLTAIKLFKFKFCIFEKVVFQSIKHFEHVLNIVNKKKIKAWVNCPRRCFPIFKFIKRKIGNKKIKILVSGYNWGMACNMIHFLDLFFF